MSRGAARVGVAMAIAAFALYAALASPYELRVLTLAGCQVLLVSGYQLIFGQVGAFSLAQGAFFGLGAYVTALLSTRYALGFLATLPLSILVPVAVAAMIAVPVLRLASHYFALATLGLAQVVLLAFTNGGEWTGGALGIAGIPGVSVFEWPIAQGRPLLILVWSIVALGALAAARLTHGLNRVGFAMLRSDPLAASAIGIDGARLRFVAFVLSAGYAGAAGALEAHTVGVVSAETLGFSVMVTCLAMTVIGGSTRITGAFLGPLLLTFLPEKLRFLEGYALLAYGVALLAIIILAPEGLAGMLAKGMTWLWSERSADALPSLRFKAEREGPARQAPRGRVRWSARAGHDADQRGDSPTSPHPSTPKGGGEFKQDGFSPRGDLLEAQGLLRRFGGIEAVAGVDLSVASGDILGLIGPNGSGKTTLANLVTGLVAPDSGRIRFRGQEIAGSAAFEIARRGIARTFQTPALPGEITALEAVAVACASRAGAIGIAAALRGRDSGAGRRALEAEALGWLEQLGLGASALRKCRDLGQVDARRIEIARALTLHPALLILDEPAAGLEGSEQANLAATLRAVAAEGLALIVIEHNMPFLLALADRVVALDAGRIIATGTPPQIRHDPAVIASYLGNAAVA